VAQPAHAVADDTIVIYRDSVKYGEHGIGRGNVRGLLLAELLHRPAHGYEMIRRLEDKAGGRWRPSAGSVYPQLQLLEDDGLVHSHEENGRRVYELTPAGRELADIDALRELSDSPASHRGELHAAVKKLHVAAKQVATAGEAGQVTRAAAIVNAARKDLYRLLADAETDADQ
jgi:DNA-binding PadR family transcriptional regulator